MTITLTYLGSILFIPTSASALAENTVSLATLLHDPLFMLVVLVGFLALGGSLIVVCVIFYRRARISEGAFGGQPSAGGEFDFSGIETPVEIQALCFDGEKDMVLGGDSADTAAFPAVDGYDAAFVSVDDKFDVLRNRDEFGDLNKFDDQGALDNTSDLDNDLFDLFEIEEPFERPSMEFTDDMIQQVIAGVERRREAERVELRTELRTELVVVSHTSEKEKSERQAVIEWLSAEHKQQGKHFRPAHFRAWGDETKAEGLAEYLPAPMKHSREKKEAFYQRVG
jgi:hypothetical protein